MSYGKEKDITNLPYTVVGGSSTPEPMQHILLTAEGIIALAKKVKSGDLIRYETWADVTNECKDKRYYSRWTLIPKAKDSK